MDEYDKIQLELQKSYSVYVERLRNLDYLEKELEQIHEGEGGEPNEENSEERGESAMKKDFSNDFVARERDPSGGFDSGSDNESLGSDGLPEEEGRNGSDLDF
jgi:hypothetical protein